MSRVKFPTRSASCCILLAALLSHTAGTSADGGYSQILAQALAAFDEDYRESWAFTEERVMEGVTAVGRYDPRTPDQWQLMSVDGREPTASEIEDYLEQKANESRGDRRQGPDSMVTPGSLSLTEETEDYWLFDFLPTVEGDQAAVMEYLDGDMKINKSGPIIEFIDVRSSEAFKPRFGVKINDFMTRMEFERLGGQGPVVPQSMHFSIDMKAFLMNVDQAVTVQYRDYEYTGEAPAVDQ
jgi:hypothetical protein